MFNIFYYIGSLLNLAKHPASTVQILGAEKALFRALKTKHDTPKYGLIYHASLVGQSNPKTKGKISRMLAAKVSLAVRVDALGEDGNTTLGIDHLAKLQRNLKLMEEGSVRKITGSGKAKAKWDKYENKSEVKTYNEAADSTLPKKRKLSEGDGEPVTKKLKKEVKEEELDTTNDVSMSTGSEKKKKKHKKVDTPGSEGDDKPDATPTASLEKKKKKKHLATEEEPKSSDTPDVGSEKKKKKKNKE